MIGLEDRRILARDIDIAHRTAHGCSLACEIAGIDVRTLQRWKAGDGLEAGDGRPQAVRPPPRHALSEAERVRCWAWPTSRASPRCRRRASCRCWPTRESTLPASPASTASARTGPERPSWPRQGAAKTMRPPTTHVATHRGEVWCWDMTYLPALVMGRWFYLYLILDLYSRKIVGWEVHDTDDAEHAAQLVRSTALAERHRHWSQKPVLHGDNGSTLKATTVLAMLQWLGVKPSYSRPRVSDDNAYAEASVPHGQVPTRVPGQAASPTSTGAPMGSRIRALVQPRSSPQRHPLRQPEPAPCRRRPGHPGRSPCAVHTRQGTATRHAGYGHTRNWSPVGAVTLNPERDSIVTEHRLLNT